MALTDEVIEKWLEFLMANAVNDALTMGLSDELGADVIHLSSNIPRLLNLSITNTLTDEVQIVAQPGPAGPDNYHFHIQFVNNQCFFRTLTTPEWLISALSDDSGFITDIYLLSTQSITLSVPPAAGSTADVQLWYSDAALKNISVEVLQVAVTVGQNVVALLSPNPQPVTGAETVHLTTFTDDNAPSPLIATMVQRRAILPDGVGRDLLLWVVNTSPEPVNFTPPPADGSPTPTAIALSVDIDDAAAWALCTSSEATSILVTPPQDWHEDKGASAAATRTDQKTWVFRPDYSKTKRIEHNSVVEFTLSGVRTTLPPGFTNLYVSLQEFPFYGTQTLVTQIEKSPLIYNSGIDSGLLSKGTAGSNHGLALNGDTTLELLLVEQTGGGNSAHFKGGSGVNIENNLALSGTINDVKIDHGVINASGLTSTGDVTVKAKLTANTLNSLGEMNTAGLVSSAAVTVKAGLTVSKQATVTEHLEAGSLTVNGDAVAGSLTVNNATTSTGLLTAKNGAHISGLLSAPGPVSVYGAYQVRKTNSQYVAATDGIVTAFVAGANPAAGFCNVRLFGYVGQTIVAQAMGGNVATFKINSASDWKAFLVQNLGNLTFPVPKGATWWVEERDSGFNQTSTYSQVLWMPLGSAQTSAEDEPAPETAPTEHPGVAQTYESDVETSISDLVGDLASIFDRELSAEEKQRLEDRVFKLVQRQPSPKVPANYESAMLNLVNVLERLLKQSFSAEEKAELADAVKQLM